MRQHWFIFTTTSDGERLYYGTDHEFHPIIGEWTGNFHTVSELIFITLLNENDQPKIRAKYYDSPTQLQIACGALDYTHDGGYDVVLVQLMNLGRRPDAT